MTIVRLIRDDNLLWGVLPKFFLNGSSFAIAFTRKQAIEAATIAIKNNFVFLSENYLAKSIGLTLETITSMFTVGLPDCAINEILCALIDSSYPAFYEDAINNYGHSYFLDTQVRCLDEPPILLSYFSSSFRDAIEKEFGDSIEGSEGNCFVYRCFSSRSAWRYFSK